MPKDYQEKPDFHMLGLAKSVRGKDAGELTVVLLGHVTELQKEAYLMGIEAVKNGVLILPPNPDNDAEGDTYQKGYNRAGRNVLDHIERVKKELN